MIVEESRKVFNILYILIRLDSSGAFRSVSSVFVNFTLKRVIFEFIAVFDALRCDVQAG